MAATAPRWSAREQPPQRAREQAGGLAGRPGPGGRLGGGQHPVQAAPPPPAEQGDRQGGPGQLGGRGQQPPLAGVDQRPGGQAGRQPAQHPGQRPQRLQVGPLQPLGQPGPDLEGQVEADRGDRHQHDHQVAGPAGAELAGQGGEQGPRPDDAEGELHQHRRHHQHQPGAEGAEPDHRPAEGDQRAQRGHADAGGQRQPGHQLPGTQRQQGQPGRVEAGVAGEAQQREQPPAEEQQQEHRLDQQQPRPRLGPRHQGQQQEPAEGQGQPGQRAQGEGGLLGPVAAAQPVAEQGQLQADQVPSQPSSSAPAWLAPTSSTKASSRLRPARTWSVGPSVMSRPRCMIPTRSHSRSTRSMTWLEKTTVAPPAV